MPELQLYDKLLQFPLFQGMGHNDLMQIVAHTKFNFIRFKQDKKVVKDGETCSNLYFLINGKLKAETVSDDHGYSVIEEFQAPYIIQPECIFGRQQRFRSTFTAVGDTNFITIDKKEVVNLCDNFIVFRINLLNIFSTQTQKLLSRPWHHHPANLREHIIRFFVYHCQHPAGRKVIMIYMERLAVEVNDSRLNVSNTLNAMQDEGLIELRRGRITIPLLERLLS